MTVLLMMMGWWGVTGCDSRVAHRRALWPSYMRCRCVASRLAA